MPRGRFSLKITDETTAYLTLPTREGTLKGGRTVTLVDLMGAYKGPYVVLDFDARDVLVGIEIVGEDEDDDEAPNANLLTITDTRGVV